VPDASYVGSTPNGTGRCGSGEGPGDLMLKPMTRSKTNQGAWSLVVLVALPSLGVAGSGLLIASAQGWELTSAWGFGRERRFAVGDKASGMQETIKLGFFGLRRSSAFPRWPQDFNPEWQGTVKRGRR
jgi:hypothetical protein